MYQHNGSCLQYCQQRKLSPELHVESAFPSACHVFWDSSLCSIDVCHFPSHLPKVIFIPTCRNSTTALFLVAEQYVLSEGKETMIMSNSPRLLFLESLYNIRLHLNWFYWVFIAISDQDINAIKSSGKSSFDHNGLGWFFIKLYNFSLE